MASESTRSDRGDFDRVPEPRPEREFTRVQQGAVVSKPGILGDQCLGGQRAGWVDRGGDHPQDREDREDDQDDRNDQADANAEPALDLMEMRNR